MRDMKELSCKALMVFYYILLRKFSNQKTKKKWTRRMNKMVKVDEGAVGLTENSVAFVKTDDSRARNGTSGKRVSSNINEFK